MDNLNCNSYNPQLVKACEDVEEDEELYNAGELASQQLKEPYSQVGRGLKRPAANPVAEPSAKKNLPSTSHENIATNQPSTSRDYTSTSTVQEPTSKAALSRRKESAAPLTGDKDGAIFGFSYPLALVLRLRVLQIVCGISAMVMGSVAFIEERQKFNMGLGIPAGGISVLAAAVSIHTSRGWAVTSGATAGAGVASVLWAGAACLLVALVVQCCRTILGPPGLENGDPFDEESRPSPRDLVVIACVQIALACATLLSAAVCARIDCT